MLPSSSVLSANAIRGSVSKVLALKYFSPWKFLDMSQKLSLRFPLVREELGRAPMSDDQSFWRATSHRSASGHKCGGGMEKAHLCTYIIKSQAKYLHLHLHCPGTSRNSAAKNRKGQDRQPSSHCHINHHRPCGPTYPPPTSISFLF